MSPLHLRGLAVLFAFYLGSCATMRAAGPGLIDCAAPMMTTLTADVLGQVGGAVRGEGFAGHAVLDGLLAQLGPLGYLLLRQNFQHRHPVEWADYLHQ